MVQEYLVVASGSPLDQNQLNNFGQNNWVLEHVIQPEDSLVFTHIFRKVV